MLDQLKQNYKIFKQRILMRKYKKIIDEKNGNFDIYFTFFI